MFKLWLNFYSWKDSESESDMIKVEIETIIDEKKLPRQTGHNNTGIFVLPYYLLSFLLSSI